jgi:hypothetical protein
VINKEAKNTPKISKDAFVAAAMRSAPPANRASLMMSVERRPKLSAKSPPQAEPIPAPKIAAVTITSWIQPSLYPATCEPSDDPHVGGVGDKSIRSLNKGMGTLWKL